MILSSRLLASTMLSAALLATPVLAQQAPFDAGPANAPDQTPASENQARAPQPDAPASVTSEVVAEGLPQLWSLEFLPDGRMLVTAKEGALHIVTPEGEATEVEGELPAVDSEGQGGLLDVALAPDFDTTGRIYFSFAEPRDDGNGTSVAAATLTLDEAGGASVSDVEVIFRQEPSYDGGLHFGSRIVPNEDGTLYVTVGERSDEPIRDQAQELESGLGKIFRIDAEGQALPDNPFVETEGARPEIWSLGHRNVQGATLDGEGRLWTAEHGARGGDELNRPEAGVNYGWPEVTYGINYDGTQIGEGVTQNAETVQPVYYWDPVIAPSGMAYYEGDEFPEWQGAFLIGGLQALGVVVLHMDGDQVAFEERVPLEARIRDVKVGPDGAVYAVTDDSSSSIIRLTHGR
ncbi:PQQ-dependent sugar dehydrogenase [Devosia rhizoryzae]|uniref:PQQ-dependent sugar dehydrogenase n=1 Tax=Devosia rhizoryzae TaxID=2774137 RepID=A0ABX7C6W7_9HYPH|nr:PQQ-dependent sugar dehydrogenase [Devosia rhizoryzae]QQR39953.1 PQQ-dependent sugar dehydrogenase [Devosia rhizoryzae]